MRYLNADGGFGVCFQVFHFSLSDRESFFRDKFGKVNLLSLNPSYCSRLPVSVERFTPVIFHGLYLAQVVLVFSLCAASGDLEHGVFAGIVASGFYRCAVDK